MTRIPVVTAASAVLLSVLIAAASAQAPPRRGAAPQGPPKLPAMGRAATETIAYGFERAEGWSLQAIALLSLGTDWHPVGGDIVLQALRSKDARLRPFGLEQLRRTDARVFASVCSAEIVDELVDLLQHKNQLLKSRALELLQRLFPGGGADAAALRRYWREHRDGYVPPAWTPKEVDKDAPGTVSGSVVDRAFDLRDAGLEVAIVIDSTGSMQVAIDAARDAVDSVVAMLASIAPKLKLGLVHYKDTTDFSDGARLLEPLSRNEDKVRERLAELQASGGGDAPEKVDAGIAVALSREMGWNKHANRLILVVGDAPPHDEDLAALLELVALAYKAPFQNPKRPTTGPPLADVRPFIVSTIATSPAPKAAFEQIAAAGGGTCVLLNLARPAAPAGRAGGGRAPAAGAAPAPAKPDAAEQIARHVLMLAFGAQFEPQLRVFVDVFFDYHRAGLF